MADMLEGKIQSFEVTPNVEWPTEPQKAEVGRGSYGAIYKVRAYGVPCIAKKVHEIFVTSEGPDKVGDKERKAVIASFRRECILLSGLRHPNIVQLIGAHFGQNWADMSLIMEAMHMDLEHCITTYPDIPHSYKIGILRDVAYGLAYLHSVPIIHRDLHAGNVLLTESLKAKITDVGVSKLLNRDQMLQTRTKCPGAQPYMPPESLQENPKYGVKLDVFSFGHLAIVLSNQEQIYLSDATITPNDLKKNQMQIGRRRRALEKMGKWHTLYPTVVHCLCDNYDRRPSSAELVKKLEEANKRIPIPHKNTLELLTLLASSKISNQKLERAQKEKEDALDELERLKETSKKEKQEMARKIDVLIEANALEKNKLREQLQVKEATIMALKEQLAQEKATIKTLSDHLKTVHSNEALCSKEQEYKELKQEHKDSSQSTENAEAYRRKYELERKENEKLRDKLHVFITEVKGRIGEFAEECLAEATLPKSNPLEKGHGMKKVVRSCSAQSFKGQEVTQPKPKKITDATRPPHQHHHSSSVYGQPTMAMSAIHPRPRPPAKQPSKTDWKTL